MKELEMEINLNEINILPEMKMLATVVIDSGGGGGGVILTHGIGNNPEEKRPMKFLIDETLLSSQILTLQVKLLTYTPTGSYTILCAPMMMMIKLTSAETLVFPLHKLPHEKIGELYVSYKSLTSWPTGPYNVDPGEYSGHGRSGSIFEVEQAYRPLTQADDLNYQLPPARSVGHLPRAYHHGSVAYSVQEPSGSIESQSRPLIDPYQPEVYPVHGYHPGYVNLAHPGYVGPPQPPGHGYLPQPVYPPMQPQVSKMKKFRDALRSAAARVGALVCGNVIAQAAAAAAAAVSGDDGDGFIY